MAMDTVSTDIKRLLAKQRNFFNTGRTKDIAFRKEKLDTLQRVIRKNEGNILKALKQDLSKSAYEGYLTEVGIILEEIRFAKKHMCKWVKPRRVRTHIFQLPASSYIYKMT